MKIRNILVCTGLLLASEVALNSPQADVNLTNHIVASADTTGYCGDNVTFSFNSSTGILTISGTGSTYDYEFDNYRPTLWNDHLDEIKTVVIEDGVTNIGKELFRNCTALTSVSIPSSVTSIDYTAFKDCASLKSITIPKGVTSIEKSAFLGCTSLTNVTISDSVTSIGSSAFWGCKNLKTVTLPDSLISIGSSAFLGCENLESITIPDSVTSIGGSAFYGCTSLKSITIPDSVTSICEYAFEDCTSLKSITIPDSVTSIGGGAFYNCTALESIVIPNSVVSIEYAHGYINGTYTYFGAFGNCTSLKSVVISDNVKIIPANTFYNCTSLESVTLGQNITKIDKEAFANCISLKNISIPGMVQNINANAFENCTSLKSVVFKNYITIDGKDYYFDGNTQYSQTLSISGYAFKGCTSLTSITLPENIRAVCDYAFIDCTSLKDITFYNSNTTIGEYAIGYTKDGSSYTRLSNVTINAPSGSPAETYAKYNGFTYKQVDSLEHDNTIEHYVNAIGTEYDSNYIDIDYDVYYIVTSDGILHIFGSGSAMYDYIAPCMSEKVTKVIIGEGIIKIGGHAFNYYSSSDAYKYKSLNSVTIPNSMDYIDWQAFASSSMDVYFQGTEEEWNRIQMYDEYNKALVRANIHYIGDDVTYSFDSSTGTLTISGTGAMVNYYSYEHVPWNEYREDIKKVVIEDGVTSIGKYAFRSCSFLTSVTIPNSVTYIGVGAFASSLTDVYFQGTREEWNSIEICSDNDCLTNASIYYTNATPIVGSCGNKVTYKFDYSTLTMTISGTGTMKNYSSDSDVPWNEYREDIKKVVIEDGVTSIGSYAFYGCTSLTDITIPHSVTSIGSYAFKNCTSLESITIPDSVTSIDGNAFYDCTALVYVYFEVKDKNNVSITVGENNGYFLRATRITNHIGNCGSNTTYTLKSSTLTMTISGTGAMKDYSNDSEVPWYELINYIGKVVIEDGVTSIGKYAFSNCVDLRSITIPNSVTSISDYAFNGCTSLTDVYFEGTEEEWRNIDIGIYNSRLKNATIHYNSTNYVNKVTFSFNSSTGTLTISGTGDMEDYSSDNSAPWHKYRENIKKVVIKDGVTSIGSYAFDHCTSLESVTMPDSLTSIGALAFINCTTLESVTIPDSVDYIDLGAFYNCTSLTNITIPNSVTSISYHVFNGCTALKSITIPDSVTSIGDYAFYCCTALTNVTIPDSVTYIGGYAFQSCTSLKNVTIPDGVTSIGDNTFNGCKALTNVTIPDSVTSIGSYAFENCTALTSVTIPDSVTSIGSYAFDDCTALTDITIPDSVTSIGDGAFKNCTALKSLEIPNSVTDYSVDDDAFSGFKSLERITLPDCVTSIGSNAFKDCTSLKSITIPDSVTSIGDYAFDGCTALTDATISGRVTSISEYAFNGCTALRSIDIPDSVTSIGDYAFYGCTALTDVYFQGTKEEWYNIMMNSGNDRLLNATIHYNSTNRISKVTFSFDSSTGILTISGTGPIKDYSENNTAPWYEYIEDINKVVIKDGVTSIGSWAFYCCTALESVTIPDSVISIGDCAFENCTSLTDVYFQGTEKYTAKISRIYVDIAMC